MSFFLNSILFPLLPFSLDHANAKGNKGQGSSLGPEPGQDILDSTEVIIKQLGATGLNFCLPCYFCLTYGLNQG